jgi:uncharacterized protein (DUF433 family)
MSTVAYPHIELRADGVPVIAGTGFKVRILVESYLAGATPDEIQKAHPQLSLGGIHGALVYYYDHRAEIDREIAEGNRFAERMMAEQQDAPIQNQMRELGW